MTDDLTPTPTPTRSIALRAKTALTSDLGGVIQYTVLVIAATLGWFRLDGRVGQVIEAGDKRDRIVEEVRGDLRNLRDVLIFQHIMDPAGLPRSSALPSSAGSVRSTPRPFTSTPLVQDATP